MYMCLYEYELRVRVYNCVSGSLKDTYFGDYSEKAVKCLRSRVSVFRLHGLEKTTSTQINCFVPGNYLNPWPFYEDGHVVKVHGCWQEINYNPSLRQIS